MQRGIERLFAFGHTGADVQIFSLGSTDGCVLKFVKLTRLNRGSHRVLPGCSESNQKPKQKRDNYH